MCCSNTPLPFQLKQWQPLSLTPLDMGSHIFLENAARFTEANMTDLAELLRAKAEIEAKIEAFKTEEVERLKLLMADTATKLRELNALSAPLVELFTDKAGTFNAYRVVKVKKS